MNKLLFIMISLSGLLATVAMAQTQETLLIYGRNVDGQFSSVFVSSDGSRSDYESQSDLCGGVSPNGQLNAFSRWENPTTVDFIHGPSNTIFGQIPWQTNWYPCSSVWSDDHTLIMRNLNDFSISAMFRLENNVLREVPITFAPTPQAPSLPRADTSGLQYIIPSNNRTKFVYHRCVEEISPENECTGGYEWAIYDLTVNREIGVLPDMDDENVRGNRGWGDRPPGLAQFYNWSPDDRYFLYAAFNSGGFSIYDTVEQRQLDVPEQNWDLDLNRLPVWSPDSRYIAYWSTGVPDVYGLDGISLSDRYRITSEEESKLYSGLLAYDAWQERELPIEVYLQIGHVNHPIVWSPNTPEIVTWDNTGNLYRLNIETSRFPTLIDTQVSGVMAWSFVQPIPTVDLPTLTPTSISTQTFTPTFTPTPTPTSTPTLTPTPLPTLTPTPAAYQKLRLTSMCSSNPAATRNWRVRNPNPYPVTFTWDIYNSPNRQRGSGVVPAAVGSVQGEVLFETVTEAGANTLRVFVNGTQQDTKASSGATCG